MGRWAASHLGLESQVSSASTPELFLPWQGEQFIHQCLLGASYTQDHAPGGARGREGWSCPHTQCPEWFRAALSSPQQHQQHQCSGLTQETLLHGSEGSYSCGPAVGESLCSSFLEESTFLLISRQGGCGAQRQTTYWPGCSVGVRGYVCKGGRLEEPPTPPVHGTQTAPLHPQQLGALG